MFFIRFFIRFLVGMLFIILGLYLTHISKTHLDVYQIISIISFFLASVSWGIVELFFEVLGDAL